MTFLLTIPATAQALTVERHNDGTTTIYDRTTDQVQNHSYNDLGTPIWNGPNHDADLVLRDLGFKDLHDANTFTGPVTITEVRAYYRGAALDEVAQTLLLEAA